MFAEHSRYLSTEQRSGFNGGSRERVDQRSPRIVYDVWRRDSKGNRPSVYDSGDVVERYAFLGE